MERRSRRRRRSPADAQSFPEVLSATFVSSRDALQRARTELKEFADLLETDILPASIDVRLKEGFRDPGLGAQSR